jgi:hypothetical protein
MTRPRRRRRRGPGRVELEGALGLGLVVVGRTAGLGELALAALVLLGDQLLDGVGVGGLEGGAGGVARGLIVFVEGEVGAELVLQAQLPLVGLGRVVPPEAAVGDGEAGVVLALAVDAGGEVARGQVGPVVVLLAVGVGQLLPPLLGVLPLRLEERPQRGAVDHDAVVQIGDVASVDLARLGLAVGGRRAALGALLDGGDEPV